jgi:hypothetical protein
MMTEVNEKEAFSAGYEAGWKARGEYIQDYRKAQSGSSFGLALMLIGGMSLIMFVSMPFIMSVIIERVITASLVAVLIIAGGYFINKAENKSYNKKQNDFSEKWG